jgi:enolase-phosphatase E1
MTRAVLTDIEGTTSSLSFVKDVLFPYARRHIAGFVRDHAFDARVRAHLDDARALAGLTAADDDRIVAELVAWIDEDRKATPLKALQGLIWEHGYRAGDFTGHVYADAVEVLRRWHQQGIALYVYSSGSVHAQQLLFAHTGHGDLTPLFSGWFDTRIGAKLETESYRRIAAEIGVPAAEILFLSDITGELDAARAAGMRTCQLVRDGAIDPAAPHRQAANFHEVGY